MNVSRELTKAEADLSEAHVVYDSNNVISAYNKLGGVLQNLQIIHKAMWRQLDLVEGEKITGRNGHVLEKLILRLRKLQPGQTITLKYIDNDTPEDVVVVKAGIRNLTCRRENNLTPIIPYDIVESFCIRDIVNSDEDFDIYVYDIVLAVRNNTAEVLQVEKITKSELVGRNVYNNIIRHFLSGECEWEIIKKCNVFDAECEIARRNLIPIGYDLLGPRAIFTKAMCILQEKGFPDNLIDFDDENGKIIFKTNKAKKISEFTSVLYEELSKEEWKVFEAISAPMDSYTDTDGDFVTDVPIEGLDDPNAITLEQSILIQQSADEIVALIPAATRSLYPEDNKQAALKFYMEHKEWF